MAGGAVERYLRDYAHAVPDAAWGHRQAQFDCVVVIPAYDESDAFLRRFASHDFGCRALLIAVINAPAGMDGAGVTRTRALLRAARQLPTRCWDTAWGAAGDMGDGVRGLHIIDCASQGRRLAPAEGVGLARKIGMDQALALIARGRVSTPLIWCSDADATLPANYFSPRIAPGEAALTFEFSHGGDADLALAQRVYDLRLRYYPRQLAASGSPYAYLALGSALAIGARAYAQVRGVPRRAAGEDFHLLNKIAKVGLIRARPEVQIKLGARTSDRVPFGTGRGVHGLLSQDDPTRLPFLYAPRSFELLAVYLRALESWASARAVPRDAAELAAQLAAATAATASASATDWPTAFEPAATRAALVRACAASDSAATRIAHIHTWFDALRTLRALHRVRDRHCPNVSARHLEREHPELVAAAWAPRTGVCGVGAATPA